ncbi:uncharacterized protein LOC125892863 [Epinephelus fuscoguttatus]|uniref:uncharacterized protein LOC125892863 n=1 Tax=Epinephelus fuscoguttatus TaxID=293821 RepID=UPI0020CFF055|nr:uncharacterized protein LOC125892863 [Epinephelus fuscoguttatus]
MSPHESPQHYLQQHQRSSPWDAASNTMPSPSDEPTRLPAGHFVPPSVLTPPATSCTPTLPNQVNAQGAGASVQTPVMTSHAPAPPSHGSMPTNHVSVQGPATTMYAPKVYENASQTPLSPPAAPLHTHPTPTAMTLNPMIPDDPRQFPPPQVYVPPGGNSLPVLLSSTCAPQITMRGTAVGIQSTVETAHIPPTNRHQHPISYPILPHPSYGMHTPSSSVRHSQVVGQPSRAFSPTPSNIVFPDTQAIQHIPQMQVNHLPPPSATWSHIQPVSYGSQAVQPPAYHMQATTQSHTLPLVLPDGPTGFSPVQPSYSGFTQTHQVKNVQVFSRGSECRILIEDWIRDMQYLLDAGGLPPNLSFPTIVRHLSGEARRLILNLPPPEQIPQRAFDELRADYGDMQRSLDPLADFYERSQRTEESACSYAIALEAPQKKKATATDNEKIVQKGVERSRTFIPPLHKKETDHLRTLNSTIN